MARRKGLGTNLIFAVVVVIIIGTIGSAAPTTRSTAQQASSGGSSASSEASTSLAHESTNSTTSASGLQLTESLNASTITVGQSLNISLSISNTRPALNTVLPSNSWPFQGVPIALWPPCYFDLPAQVVVLNGSYTLQDLQKVANVSFGYGCMEGGTINQVVFQPNSDEANITGIWNAPGTSVNETLGPSHMSFNFTTAGYWDLASLAGEPNIPILGVSQSAPPAYTPFSPGVYTIAVEDEWGQAVVMHLTVVPASQGSTSVSSMVASTVPPCSAPDVYCGTFEVVSANLTANSNDSVLKVTLLESGDVYMSSATVYVNGTIIGAPPASTRQQPGNIRVNLVPKQQTTLALTIPNTTLSVQAGRNYNVTVYAWVGTPSKPQSYTNTPQSIDVLAVSSAGTSSSALVTSSSSTASSTSLGITYVSLVVVAGGMILSSVLFASHRRDRAGRKKHLRPANYSTTCG